LNHNQKVPRGQGARGRGLRPDASAQTRRNDRSQANDIMSQAFNHNP
jgi:hypothetical protein